MNKKKLIVSSLLLFFSLIGSLGYGIYGFLYPQDISVYLKAGIPLWGIEAWAIVLFISGMMLLSIQSFRAALYLLIGNSLFTITCFIYISDGLGALLEVIYLFIPVILLKLGSPFSYIKGNKSL
ncbi:hypothetical protein [Parendozoicomonas sp. Alg238-R29]|uniref:hypothetical protein n=1 Tax=Parendozoicomonas sp. Alg238-R29 TaxID=2993446 RepID=UPI00248D7C79|nr:hypothetical protein [Parendozoicomonas sp. Alg238-R29]